MRGFVAKPTGTSYHIYNVLNCSPDGRFGNLFLIRKAFNFDKSPKSMYWSTCNNVKQFIKKCKATSARVSYATRSHYARSYPRTEGVPSNNHKGRGSGPYFWGCLDKSCHIVPNLLLARVQRPMKDLYKAVEEQSSTTTYTKPISCLILGTIYIYHSTWALKNKLVLNLDSGKDPSLFK